MNEQPPYFTQHQALLSAEAHPLPNGKFHITCITSGIGNGWTFPPEVLQASLALWDNLPCFIDHSWIPHSLKDLAGHVVDPAWDPEAQGITATLHPLARVASFCLPWAKKFSNLKNPLKLASLPMYSSKPMASK